MSRYRPLTALLAELEELVDTGTDRAVVSAWGVVVTLAERHPTTWVPAPDLEGALLGLAWSHGLTLSREERLLLATAAGLAVAHRDR